MDSTIRSLGRASVAWMRFLAHVGRYLIFLAAIGAAATARAAPDWVATWAASPTGPLINAGGPTFADQTVRMVVRASVGGDAVRLRLSNEFGTTPLSIGEVHVALQGPGADLVPDSDRRLTFSGSRTVVIPPGSTILSDEVALKVTALTHVSVSVFFPESTGRPTFHAMCLCVSRIAAQNVTADPHFPAGKDQPLWFFLTGIDVRPTRPTQTIVAFGDSLTDGYRANTDGAWPSVFAERLAARRADFAVVNAAISGNSLLHEFVNPSGLARFERDVLAQAGVKYVVLLFGINDIGASWPHKPHVSAEDIVDGYRQLVARAHARGVKVYGATLPPIGGSRAYDTPDNEVRREAVNRAVRAGGIFDATIDFDAVLRDPEQPRKLLAEYDSGDHLHPGVFGYQRMARAIDIALFGVDDGPSDDAGRAKASWDALVKSMAVPDRPGLFFNAPDRRSVSDVRAHSQIVHAALDLALLTGQTADAESTLNALHHYELDGAWASATRPFREKPSWEDNGWVLLALEQALNQSFDKAKYLHMIETAWSSFILRGQAPDGGIYWYDRNPSPQRAASSTGSTIEAALRLHLMTAQPNGPSPYRAFAELNDRWLTTHLRAPQGFYWGRWDDDPSHANDANCHPSPSVPPPMNVCEGMSTNNQGAAIGADVLFFRIDGDRTRLDRAAETAAATLAYFTTERLWRQPPGANAIFFRNLIVLDHYKPDPRYRAALQAYLDRVWREARDPLTGLFSEGDIGKFRFTFNSLDQAAIVQMFVLLALPPERIVDLT